MHLGVLSGIRPSFPSLSRSAGQITHVLLTRSPLEHPASRAFPFDLHVLSTPPAFVLSQDQTLQTKTPHHNRQGSQSIRENLTKRHHKNWHHKKQPHPHTGTRKAWPKNNNKNKTTKHTIEFSNNTLRPRNKPRGFWPLTRCADDEGPTEVELPSGTSSRSTAWPCRDDSIKLRERKR